MLDIGDLLDGKYRLQRLLGVGGMGTVYEALHEQINKPVAVKLLLPQDGAEGELVARFHREAQAAASAGHRGIVDIYDVGVCDDGAPFLVMELLQGENLGDLLERRAKLDVDFTAYVVCHVLSALSAAHCAGVVHRDLKPDNIFLVESGAALPEVKLLDFGISRVIVPGSVTRMTRSGAVMGTPHYMSPEQSAGKNDIDHRTDLFSIGVILYECLTGELPFDADNYNALLVKIISEEPRPPSELLAEIPPRIETAILRALRKRRAERYQDAAEIFADLQGFVDSGAIATLRVPISLAGAVPTTEKELPSPRADVETADATPTAAATPAARRPLPETGIFPEPTAPSREDGKKPLALQLLAVLAVIVIVGVVAGVAASMVYRSPADELEATRPASNPHEDAARVSGEVDEPSPGTAEAGLPRSIEVVATDADAASIEDAAESKTLKNLVSSNHPPRSKVPSKTGDGGVGTPSADDYGTEIDQPVVEPRPPSGERPRGGGASLRDPAHAVREETPPRPIDYGDEID